MTKEQIETSVLAVNRFIFHAWNYKLDRDHILTAEGEHCVPEFISKVPWSCNIDHLYIKWLHVYNKYGSSSAMFAFYAELDSENRRALIEWVMENYHGEQKI